MAHHCFNCGEPCDCEEPNYFDCKGCGCLDFFDEDYDDFDLDPNEEYKNLTP